MYLRKLSGQKTEVSFDEPLNTDWDGNELLLSDILGTEEDEVCRALEDDAEKRVLLEAWTAWRGGRRRSFSCASDFQGDRNIPRRRSPTCWASPRATFRAWKSASLNACAGM